MVRLRGYLLIAVAILPFLAWSCSGADQDRAGRRRALAEQTCEEAVRDQLASRATARFSSESEHVYFDSAGGAAVAGMVATATAQRNFACILKPASDSTWLLSAAKLLN
jgi:hypothetical protein